MPFAGVGTQDWSTERERKPSFFEAKLSKYCVHGGRVIFKSVEINVAVAGILFERSGRDSCNGLPI